jgi:predicted glycogen debranching enzyme
MASGNFNDFNKASSLEWLETNGLGGYASGTISGAHTRRYHGLLVAAMHPPVGRMVVVSKLEETIVLENDRFELGANQYPGAVHPAGFAYLQSFTRNLFPEFRYQVRGIELKKTIAAIQGENTTVVLYEVLDAPTAFNLEFLPLYSCRDFHSLAHENDSMNRYYLFDDGIFKAKNYEGCPEFFISIPGASFEFKPDWYRNFEYAVEQYRGLDFREDLFTHGRFSLTLKKGDKLGIIISTEDAQGREAFAMFAREQERRESITKPFRWRDGLARLALAADQFTVKRGELKTIIAGYHWFSDWGRDSMIALPGLCLATGRFEDAKNILKAFAESVSKGMLPNRFPDYGETPEYNTIDATLWFFHALYKYYQYTNDIQFIKLMLPVLEDSIAWHYKGTRYGIQVDATDELLYGGEEGVQLTWMDAKVGDWVVTPRKGKAVEINALWYNALSILNVFFMETGDTKAAKPYLEKSEKVKESFNQKFWNDSQNCLFDFLDGEVRNDDLRPNQLLAISLPFSMLSPERAIKILDTVSNYLLTSRGLRSLSQSHKNYKPYYGGDPWQRDSSYHQGTVWSFLLGPFVDSLIRVKGNKGKAEAAHIIRKFMEHLDEVGVGTVSEIFDAEPPHAPRGCIAQAWSVAEVLRVAVEHDLFKKV